MRLRAWEAHAIRVADEAHLAETARRAKIQAESTRLALDAQAGIALEFMRRVEADPDLLARMDFETLCQRAEASNRGLDRLRRADRLANGMTIDHPGCRAGVQARMGARRP